MSRFGDPNKAPGESSGPGSGTDKKQTMSKRRAFAFMVAGLLILLALFLGWRTYSRHHKQADMATALAHNARGVGLMDQFRYEEAAAEFTKATAAAPDWLPGQINLGIALLNANKPETIDRAIGIFRDVLTRDADNRHAHYCLGLLLLHHKNFLEAIPHFEAV